MNILQVISKLFCLLFSGFLIISCSTLAEYSLKSRSSKYLNCGSDEIVISNILSKRTALNGTTMWTASCRGQSVRCTYQEQNAIFFGPGPYSTIPQTFIAHDTRTQGPTSLIPLSINTTCN